MDGNRTRVSNLGRWSNNHYTTTALEQRMGIEPTPYPWQGYVLAVILPLQVTNEIRYGKHKIEFRSFCICADF